MFGVALTRTAAVARQLIPNLQSNSTLITNLGGPSAMSTAITASSTQMGKLTPVETALFVCDVQERFRPLISGYPAVIDTSRRMVRAAEALQLPIIVSEQYPKALGATVSEISEVLPPGTPVVAKTKFSMCVKDILQAIESLPQIKKVLIVGIETHVCVLQTALDLIERGYEVHILVDGVSSRKLTDRATALHRLSQSGAFMATSEMVMFQMMLDTDHPAFKAVSAMCKEERPEELPAI